jgi:glucose/arabinose dehydrogenase
VRKVLSAALVLALFACTEAAPPRGERLSGITTPAGFRLEMFSGGLPGARFMAFDPAGVLYVTLTGKGKVVALPERDGAAAPETVLAGLRRPHGIAFHGGYLYVAETDMVSRYPYEPEGRNLGKRQELLPLPGGGRHFTRTIVFGPDGKMYVSVGSSCNACVEKDPRRAAVIRADADGTGAEVIARGLRNTVGLAFHPETGELFGGDNGRDWLGDDLPPEEVNVIKEGNDYGWPFCYGDRVPDPEMDNAAFCPKTTPPVATIQAHSAPLGLCFATGGSLPEEYRGRLFVALHGSWNRTVPVGYKVVSFRMKNGRPAGPPEDFASGWLADGGKTGRPVDVVQGPRGGLYISDDYAGAVYRVTYTGRK